MRFTEDMMKALKPYEPFFKTAVNGNWSRYPGLAALEQMSAALRTVGVNRLINSNCQSCVLGLIQACGAIYFKTLETPAEAPTAKSASSTKSRRKAK